MVDLLTRVIYVFANIDVILLKVVAFGITYLLIINS